MNQREQGDNRKNKTRKKRGRTQRDKGPGCLGRPGCARVTGFAPPPGELGSGAVVKSSVDIIYVKQMNGRGVGASRLDSRRRGMLPSPAACTPTCMVAPRVCKPGGPTALPLGIIRLPFPCVGWRQPGQARFSNLDYSVVPGRERHRASPRGEGDGEN